METISMSKKEIRYEEIIPPIITGKLSQSEAALFLGLSIRQVKRLCKRYTKEELQGLTLKDRGNPSNNKRDCPFFCVNDINHITSSLSP